MYSYSNNKYAKNRKALDYKKLLKNTSQKAKTKTEQAQNSIFSVTEPSWMSKNQKTISFDDGSISADNLPGLFSSDVPESLKRNEAQNPKNEGLRIKSSVAKTLSASTGKDHSKAFDGIDDKIIEKNISLADDTVKKNTQKRAYLSDYPNMRDGMALFYAAAESGDRKAAKLARQAAYVKNNSSRGDIDSVANPNKSNTIMLNKENNAQNIVDENTQSLANTDNKQIDFFKAPKSARSVFEEYFSQKNSSVDGKTYYDMVKSMTKTDRNMGLKVGKKDNTFYYDYTRAIMNRISEVLPTFQAHRVNSFTEYIDRMSPRFFGKYILSSPSFSEYQAHILSELMYFYEQVNHGAPWDIKVDASWETQFGDLRMPYYDGTEDNERFLFRGELITREDLGNITYGYLGSAMGLGELTLFWGAGVAQKGIKGIFYGDVYDSEGHYGDEENDHEFVKKGIAMFYEDFPDAKPGINRLLP